MTGSLRVRVSPYDLHALQWEDGRAVWNGARAPESAESECQEKSS